MGRRARDVVTGVAVLIGIAVLIWITTLLLEDVEQIPVFAPPGAPIAPPGAVAPPEGMDTLP